MCAPDRELYSPTMDTRGPSAPFLLEASGLTRQLPARRGEPDRHAIRDVSLTMRTGEVLGLLGLNGAGKSTTLRVLSGCLVPHAGSVHIDGHDLAGEPLAARAALGYLADAPALYDGLRVSDQLALAARLRRLPRKAIGPAVDAAIEECDLTKAARQRCGTLSRGFRQRVGIAQAIVHDPRVVLLDEPGNGLDPRQMQQMRELVHRLGERRAVLLSSHLLGEVQASCTRIAVLHHGALIAERSLQELAGDGQTLAELFASLLETGAPGEVAGDGRSRGHDGHDDDDDDGGGGGGGRRYAP